ncbi:putative F420-dependent oxidoreductase [Saccharothrix texasensis]|uniref:Putative F420-dependent oxidoreductase n=2 Tax=Saccharothrix texasensis TaxID=103734 RepID=A0A3N1GX74_9PSEU|nr:putative F420-dependent oxidoreductase [Saccharothrix texasensis]
MQIGEPWTLAGFAEQARYAQEHGYSGVWSAEAAHDPFLPLVSAASAAPRVDLGTAIAVAFARNPMSLAHTAHDLATLSGGRFLLGLGSQVRSHVERRFGMPWGHPARRMREFIQALRAIWASWNTGERLAFRGEFYSHTLTTPFFAPPPCPSGPPKVYLAAVGDRMTEVAGSVCDGLIPHSFTTERYLRERTLPLVHRALTASGRDPAGFSVNLAGLVVTGATEEAMAVADRRVREQIAFYGSTTDYVGVLELHGWAELGSELNRLARSSRDDRWRTMGDLIDDEVLHAFAVVAEPDRLGDAVAARFGDVVDRFRFYAPYEHHPGMLLPAVDVLNLRAER